MGDAQYYAWGMALVSVLLGVSWTRFYQKKQHALPHQSSTSGWRTQAIRFFYVVGLPYLAIIFGIITPRFLGLTGLEHFAAVDWAGDSWAIQLQQALTLFLLRLLFDAPATILAGAAALLLLGAVWLVLMRSGATFVFPRRTGLDALYDALHWTFYRSIFWVVTADLYLGTVLGAALALLELGIISRIQGWHTSQQQQFFVQTCLLLLTAAVFYYSPNWWLLLPLHLAMVMLVNHQRQTARPQIVLP